MKKNLFFVLSLMLGLICVSFAQNAGNNDRYNLAVYATGVQNDQPLSNSLLTVVQNKTITKLTGEGNYRLIERSNEFLRQIHNEQIMQQSGEVADGQIAEIGAGLGAQKICVVSITIIDKYLYIATRIVDVATKTSYESGDAEVKNYNSIPILTSTLEIALNKMLTTNREKSYVSPLPEPSNPTNTHFSNQEYSTNISNKKADFDAYKKRLKKEKGGFLDMNSLAYKKYQDYRTYLVTGSVLTAGGILLAAVGYLFTGMAGDNVAIVCYSTGSGMVISGIVLLSLTNKQLRQSYQYYLNGDRQTSTLQFYPYYGANNTFGAGLTLRF